MALPFDRRTAEATLVEILDGTQGNRMVGMGFRLLDGVIATACQCLPRFGGKLLLPDPDHPGEAPVIVRVRPGGAETAIVATVIAADPCSNYALLAPAEELPAGLGVASVASAPFRDGAVFVFTHDRRWVQGTATPASISILSPENRLRGRTSGAPVFDERGSVVGLVGHNDVRLPDATLCALGDQLPGWVLREAWTSTTRKGTGAP
jgi:hypothetical protein